MILTTTTTTFHSNTPNPERPVIGRSIKSHMKRITKSEADAAGYRSITTSIFPERETEKPIVASIEKSLRSVDAVWIVAPDGTLQAARKAAELILTRELLEKIPNRP